MYNYYCYDMSASIVSTFLFLNSILMAWSIFTPVKWSLTIIFHVVFFPIFPYSPSLSFSLPSPIFYVLFCCSRLRCFIKIPLAFHSLYTSLQNFPIALLLFHILLIHLFILPFYFIIR